MRVLFITGEFPPMQGGVGDCTNEIALALAQRGVDVSVLTTDSGPSVSNLQSPISNLQSPISSPASSSLNILRTIPTWNWSALKHIRKTIASTRADIYHIQYQTGAFGMHPMINFAPRLLATAPEFRTYTEGRGVRSVVTFHDLRPMYLFPKAGPLRDWVTFHLARTTDAVIATNQADALRLETCNLKLETLIPIGSNIPVSPPADFNRDLVRAQRGVQPGETLLCYFGFLNDSKGGDTLVRALAEIPNAKLLLLGGQTGASDVTNAAYLEQVKRVISDMGLEHRVIWTDFMPQAEISAHFLASDICVLPYRDGASYRRGTFMAALAHGMPIITTTVNGPPPTAHEMGPSSAVGGRLPLLCDGENVLLIPPDDPHAMADAVKRLAASPALRAKLQQGAREAAQFFTWDKIADAHLALYQQLLEHPQ